MWVKFGLGRVERLVLALHRSRLSGIPAIGVTELGADEDAIEPTRKNDRLFDLGVSRSVVRFCVRTGESALISSLRQAVGSTRSIPRPALFRHCWRVHWIGF